MLRNKIKFRRPKVNTSMCLRIFTLPSRFCGTCSLREGTAVVIVSIQLMMLGCLAGALVALLVYPTQMNTLWKDKLQKDFVKWYSHESDLGYGTRHNETWKYVAWSVVGGSSAYTGLGLSVVYGVILKAAHPCWFVPWLICTFILLLISYAFAGTLATYFIIFILRREVTITIDVVPIVCVIMFVMIWNYGFIIVLAHAKKRYLARKIIHAAKMAKKNKGNRPNIPKPGTSIKQVIEVAQSDESKEESDKITTLKPQAKPSTVPTLPPIPLPTVRVNHEPLY